MKINCLKNAIVILAALTLGCSVVFAEPATPADSNSCAQKHKKSDAQRHRGQFMQKLSEKLNLTDAQKTSVKAIFAGDANEIKAIRQDNSLSEEQKKVKIKEIREAENTKINAKLTPEQQTKWAELKKHSKEARNKRMHSGQGQHKPADSNS
jgi:Spy/CpxP family protein refolding chaperone